MQFNSSCDHWNLYVKISSTVPWEFLNNLFFMECIFFFLNMHFLIQSIDFNFGFTISTTLHSKFSFCHNLFEYGNMAMWKRFIGIKDTWILVCPILFDFPLFIFRSSLQQNILQLLFCRKGVYRLWKLFCYWCWCNIWA